MGCMLKEMTYNMSGSIMVWFGRAFETRDFILKGNVREIWCFVFGFGLWND